MRKCFLTLVLVLVAASAFGQSANHKHAAAHPGLGDQLELVIRACEPATSGCFAVISMASGPLPVGTVIVSGILSTPTGVGEDVPAALVLPAEVPAGSGVGRTIFGGVPPESWGSGCAAFFVRVEIPGNKPQSRTLLVPVGDWHDTCTAVTKQ